MKGTSTIKLSHETMVAALTLYFKDVVFKENALPEVRNITPVKKGADRYDESWEYSIEVAERVASAGG